MTEEWLVGSAEAMNAMRTLKRNNAWRMNSLDVQKKDRRSADPKHGQQKKIVTECECQPDLPAISKRRHSDENLPQPRHFDFFGFWFPCDAGARAPTG
jgi:hypothetical protein